MERTLQQTNSNCIKVVLFGPESSGKSTLAKELADHYNSIYVEEYAREYLQKKYDLNQEICSYDDLIPIAKGQIRLENEASKKCNSILFCDTDLLTTKIYSEIYFDECDPLINEYAIKNKYDLYLLMDVDIPWVKDDLRDKPYERKEIFEYFKKTLEKHNKTYNLINGSFSERKLKSIEIIDKIINIVT